MQHTHRSNSRHPNLTARAPSGALLAKLLCILCALCVLASAPNPAHAEQVLAVQDHFGLMLPQGWKVNLLSQDPGAVILGVNAPAFGISASFYIMRLETSPDRTEEQIFKTFAQIDEAAGLTPKDPPKLPAHTCPLRAAVLSNDALAVILLSCKHPTAPRLYLWRLEVPSNLMPEADKVIGSLGNFVTANFVIFDPTTQQPLGTLPPALSYPLPPHPPPPPTTPPTDPTTPPTTPPTDPTNPTPPTTPPTNP